MLQLVQPTIDVVELLGDEAERARHGMGERGDLLGERHRLGQGRLGAAGAAGPPSARRHRTGLWLIPGAPAATGAPGAPGGLLPGGRFDPSRGAGETFERGGKGSGRLAVEFQPDSCFVVDGVRGRGPPAGSLGPEPADQRVEVLGCGKLVVWGTHSQVGTLINPVGHHRDQLTSQAVELVVGGEGLPGLREGSEIVGSLHERAEVRADVLGIARG